MMKGDRAVECIHIFTQQGGQDLKIISVSIWFRPFSKCLPLFYTQTDKLQTSIKFCMNSFQISLRRSLTFFNLNIVGVFAKTT